MPKLRRSRQQVTVIAFPTVLLRALKVTGDPTKESDYESCKRWSFWSHDHMELTLANSTGLSPVITIQH
jgi:hypothetical protein